MRRQGDNIVHKEHLKLGKKETTQFLNGQNIWTNTQPKTYEWQISM
jgi:hypothetical protein